MATSEHAFNQVRRILEKIDRSIDEARSRRTTSPSPPSNGQHVPSQPAKAQVLRAERIEPRPANRDAP